MSRMPDSTTWSLLVTPSRGDGPGCRRQARPASVIAEPVYRSDMPEEVPRTWILTLRDRSMSPKRQRSYIDELGGVDAVFCVDTATTLCTASQDPWPRFWSNAAAFGRNPDRVGARP